MGVKRVTLKVGVPATGLDHLAIDWTGAFAASTGAEMLILRYESEVLTPATTAPEEDERALDAKLQALTRQSATPVRIVRRSSFAYGIDEVIADHLRISDLGVMPLPKASAIGTRMILSGALFDGGAPILVLPEGHFRADRLPRRVVVGLDGTAAGARALKSLVAMDLPGAEVIITRVSPEPDDRLSQSGIEAAHLAAMHGMKAEFRLARGDDRHAVQSLEAVAADVGADLLVIGAIRRRPLTEAIFGSVTGDILDGKVRLPTMLVPG